MKQKEAIRKIRNLRHLLSNENIYKKVAEREQTKHKRRIHEYEQSIKILHGRIDTQQGYIDESSSTISSLESQIKKLEGALE